MSYDRIRKELQTATCACGKGTVTRLYYYEMNDWNQTREGYTDEEIHCEDCRVKYHIDCNTTYFTQPKWKGDGQRTDYYLVPNGLTTHHRADTMHFNFTIDEWCAAAFPEAELKDALEDMVTNKYSTRLTTEAAKEIVEHYYR